MDSALMTAGGDDLISSSSTSLFVGDLPKYCSETDLEQLFSTFGYVIDTKIKRNATEGRTLTFAFVTFTHFEAAEAARLRLDGYLFMGRRLRIRWAVQNAKPFEMEPGAVVNSVYFRFSTQRLDQTITDFELAKIFSTVGQVEDVSVKESFIDHRMGRQCGYGFVHYPAGGEGVRMAFGAVHSLHNAVVQGISLSVELSKNLLKQFGPAIPSVKGKGAGMGVGRGGAGRGGE